MTPEEQEAVEKDLTVKNIKIGSIPAIDNPDETLKVVEKLQKDREKGK